MEGSFFEGSDFWVQDFGLFGGSLASTIKDPQHHILIIMSPILSSSLLLRLVGHVVVYFYREYKYGGVLAKQSSAVRGLARLLFSEVQSIRKLGKRMWDLDTCGCS